MSYVFCLVSNITAVPNHASLRYLAPNVLQRARASSPYFVINIQPYKARFIAASSSCTTTRLSKLITSCLKLVKSHCISYCNTIYDRTGVNAMWIINNSLDVIQMIGRKQFQTTSVTTWDFSTLYTSIPHEKLKHRIHELLEKTYAVRRKSFIATDNFRTFWTDEKKCNIIFHVEIFAVLLIFLSIISSSVLEVKYLDKLLVFLWVRTAHRC